MSALTTCMAVNAPPLAALGSLLSGLLLQRFHRGGVAHGKSLLRGCAEMQRVATVFQIGRIGETDIGHFGAYSFYRAAHRFNIGIFRRRQKRAELPDDNRHIRHI